MSEEPMESGLLQVITCIPTKEAVDPYKDVGMAVMVARLFWNQTTGEMLADIRVCSEGIVGLGLHPEVDKHPSLTLQELLNFNS